jgi:hypothetical protein
LHSDTLVSPLAPLYLPAGQFVNSGALVVDPPLLAYFPGALSADLQRVSPGRFWYSLPAVHAVQVEGVVAPTVSLALPGAQDEQPVSNEVAPPGEWMQLNPDVLHAALVQSLYGDPSQELS